MMWSSPSDHVTPMLPSKSMAIKSFDFSLWPNVIYWNLTSFTSVRQVQWTSYTDWMSRSTAFNCNQTFCSYPHQKSLVHYFGVVLILYLLSTLSNFRHNEISGKSMPHFVSCQMRYGSMAELFSKAMTRRGQWEFTFPVAQILWAKPLLQGWPKVEQT